MLYHHCTTNLNHAQPRYWRSNCFTPLLSQTFSTLTQYMSASHGYNTIGGIECAGGCEAKGGDGHIDSAYQWAMEMPINRYHCE